MAVLKPACMCKGKNAQVGRKSVRLLLLKGLRGRKLVISEMLKTCRDRSVRLHRLRKNVITLTSQNAQRLQFASNEGLEKRAALKNAEIHFNSSI